MKHLVSILFLGLILIRCQKEELDYRDIYTGNWDFEVTYTSEVGDEIRESVFDCQGMIQKGGDKTSMSLHHCINDYLLIKVSEDGVVYSLDNELMGIIDSETCLIIDNQPNESSISKITIKGVK